MYCQACGNTMWHDALPGQSLKTYCPVCEPPKKRTALDDVPKSQMVAKKGRVVIEIVEHVAQLPEKAPVGAMRICTEDQQTYCYISDIEGWKAVGTADDAADVIEGPSRRIKQMKDKKNNRRAAIAATKRKIEERERANREG